MKNIGNGSAIIIWSTTGGEFGFDMGSCGDSKRTICKVDGIKMMSFLLD